MCHKKQLTAEAVIFGGLSEAAWDQFGGREGEWLFRGFFAPQNMLLQWFNFNILNVPPQARQQLLSGLMCQFWFLCASFNMKKNACVAMSAVCAGWSDQAEYAEELD